VPVAAFTVSVIDIDDDALVTISGALDAATCETLSRRLQPLLMDSVSDVVVDLSHIVFADSTAAHLLTQLSLELLGGGRRLILTNPSRSVARLLSLTDLSIWLPSPR
jgi:anti-anti-sigma factor